MRALTGSRALKRCLCFEREI